MPNSLSPDLLAKMHAYWRAANYLSVGQIYLQKNPLVETPLQLQDIKTRIESLRGFFKAIDTLAVYLLSLPSLDLAEISQLIPDADGKDPLEEVAQDEEPGANG